MKIKSLRQPPHSLINRLIHRLELQLLSIYLFTSQIKMHLLGWTILLLVHFDVRLVHGETVVELFRG